MSFQRTVSVKETLPNSNNVPCFVRKAPRLKGKFDGFVELASDVYLNGLSLMQKVG